jgi:hypothetical protein
MEHTNANPAGGDGGAAKESSSALKVPQITAATRTTQDVSARLSPLTIFTARADARALLWQAGELNLHDAVDELQAAAAASGLVAQLGQDAVQSVMAKAFTAVRDAFPEPKDMVPDDIEAATPVKRKGVAASTIMAVEYLVREGDAERLRCWLAKLSATERTSIREHLGRRTCR